MTINEDSKIFISQLDLQFQVQIQDLVQKILNLKNTDLFSVQNCLMKQCNLNYTF